MSEARTDANGSAGAFLSALSGEYAQNAPVRSRRQRETTSARRTARRRNTAFSLYIVGALVARLLEEELAPSRLTANDLGLLSAVGQAGRTTPTELSVLLGTPPTTLTRRIRALVQRRYIRRIANPDDGRSYQIELTRTGHRVWLSSLTAVQRTLARIDDELRVDVDDLEEMLIELERALHAALGRDTMRQANAPEPQPVSIRGT
jgi:DNA-binding MarR family transcriptional regulator